MERPIDKYTKIEIIIFVILRKFILAEMNKGGIIRIEQKTILPYKSMKEMGIGITPVIQIIGRMERFINLPIKPAEIILRKEPLNNLVEYIAGKKDWGNVANSCFSMSRLRDDEKAEYYEIRRNQLNLTTIKKMNEAKVIRRGIFVKK